MSGGAGLASLGARAPRSSGWASSSHAPGIPTPPTPLHMLRRSSSAEREGDQHVAKALAASPPLGSGLLSDSPAAFSLAGGAAMVVKYGLSSVAGLGLHHVQPNVHHDPATRSACVFTGAPCTRRHPPHCTHLSRPPAEPG